MGERQEEATIGFGDDLIASSLAKGAAARGEKIAFGDGQKIIWGPYSKEIFRNNPNVAHPGQERASNVRWIRYHKGHRIYNKQGDGRWVWNYDFKVKPGEFFFDDTEYPVTGIPRDDLILIEPNVPKKPCGPNKQWPVDRFKAVVDELLRAGFDVRQFDYGGPHRVAPGIITKSYREAAALLSQCRLAILPEGGLHHAAAAVGVSAVVLFGGFVPPAVLGYDSHTNLTGGATACGSFTRCQHCIDAMDAITVDDVLSAAEVHLS